MSKNFKFQNSNFKFGFSLIELLVVIGIMGTLVTLLLPNFIGARQRGKDARRKLDIEQIRSALENYRSVNGVYPTGVPVNCPPSTGAITDATATYLSKLPQDPSCPTYQYAAPTATNTDYTVCAYLESTTTSTGINTTCGGVACNYCLGPYGNK